MDALKQMKTCDTEEGVNMWTIDAQWYIEDVWSNRAHKRIAVVVDNNDHDLNKLGAGLRSYPAELRHHILILVLTLQCRTTFHPQPNNLLYLSVRLFSTH